MDHGTDELYTVKNAYWLGNFEEAIGEARALRLKTDALKQERDAYVYRSHIGLGNYAEVLDEVKEGPSVPIAHQALRLLAVYLGSPEQREVALLKLEDWLADADAAANATLQLVAATIYMHEEQFGAALKAIRGNASMEQMALNVQLYLRIDRADLAEKALAALTAADDEAALTQLSTGLVYLALGGDKSKDASLVYKDLMDRHGPSRAVLNGLAVAYTAMRRFDDAERLLQEALAKAPGDPDTLVNLIAVAEQTGRAAEAAGKWLPQLREAAPAHPALHQLDLALGSFDRVAAAFAL